MEMYTIDKFNNSGEPLKKKNCVQCVLPNAESTSRVQSFPQSLIPVLSAMRAGVIPCYPVAHAHSRYPNCPGGKDIIFIPGHSSFFFVTSLSYV